MGSLRALFGGRVGGSSLFDDIQPPSALAPSVPVAPPSTLAEKFGRAYRAIEQAPSIAASYYSPGGEQVLSEGLTPEPPSIAGLVEQGGLTQDQIDNATYGEAIGRKLGGFAAEMGASPTNAALLLGTAGLGNIAARGATGAAALGAEGFLTPAAAEAAAAAVTRGKLAELAQRGISLGFAGQMIPGAAEKLGGAAERYGREGFTPGVAGELVGGLAETGLAGLAGAHAVSPRAIPAIERDLAARRALEPAPEVVPEVGSPQPDLGTVRPPLQRPAFLDEVDRSAPTLPLGPELGYGRGGVPVERPIAQDAPQRVVAPPDVVPPVQAELRSPSEAVGVGAQPVVEAAAPLQPVVADPYADLLGRLPESDRAVVEQAVHRAGTTDRLTGLRNKAGWEELAQTIGDNDHATVIDLRGFKAVNDTYGHGQADAILRTVGGLVKEHFGEESARQGGDEFGAVLRNVTPEQAQAKVDAFNAALSQTTHTLEGPNGERIDIPAVQAHIGNARGRDAATAADLAANAHRNVQGSGRRATDANLDRPESGTPPLPEPGLQDRQVAAPAVPETPPVPRPAEQAPLAEQSELVGEPKFAVAKRPNNPFRDKATRARELADQLNRPTARESAMEQAFPLGAGFGHGSMRSRERGIDASVTRSVRAVEAAKNADYLEARAQAYDEGKINAQGRSISVGSGERIEKAAASRESRAERIAAAREARGTKEPWEVTRQVYSDASGQLGGSGRKLVESDHAEYVAKAAADGKPVPPEVLADYPDLTQNVGTSAQMPTFRATSEQGQGVTVDHVKAAFPRAQVAERDGGWAVKLPGNRTIRVDSRGEIAYQPEAFEKGYGRQIGENEQIVGSFNRIGRDAIIQLAKQADAGTVLHESFHAAMDLALSPKERDAVLRHYKNEEAAAEAYAKWKPREQSHGLFSKIAAFFRNIYRSFRPSWESAFEATRSGKAFEREAPGGAASARYGVAERKAEIERLREENKDALGTPLMSEGNVSPAQLGMMSKRQLSDYQERTMRRMDTEARIRDLSRSDEQIASEQSSADAKKRADKIESLRRNEQQLRDLAARGMSTRKYTKQADALAVERAALEASATKYATARDRALLGRRTAEGEGEPTPYSEQRYRHSQPVRIEWPDGDVHYDEVKGLNKGHALARAEANWPGAKVTIAETAEPPKYATAPKTPPQMPERKLKPIPPKAPVPKEELGRPMRPGEAPRVETKVANLKEVAPDVSLARDAPRTWKSLDPQIREKLDTLTSNPEKEANFYQKVASGRINDVEVQTLDALVAGKRESYENVRERLEKAKAEGRETGPDNVALLQAALDRATAELAKAAKSDVQAGTRLARALAARARVMDAAGRSTPDQFLKRVFKEIPGATEAQAAELVNIMRDRPGDLPDAIRALTKPSFFRKWLEFYKAGLLSGIPTHVANTTGNALEQSIRLAETATAAGVEKALGAKSRERFAGEAGAELAGAGRAVGPAFDNFTRAFKDIMTLQPESLNVSAKFDNQVGAISGKKGRFVRIPFRLLDAADSFFKEVGGEAEIGKLAYRKASMELKNAPKEVIQKRALKIAEEVRSENSEQHGDIIKAVAESRKARTFQQDPGDIANAFLRLSQQKPGLQLIAPFVRTPTNLAKAAIERSPFGLIDATKAYREYKAGKISSGAAADRIARPLLGTALFATAYGIARGVAPGIGMTGSGPVDPRENSLWRDTGAQSYAFTIEGENGKKTYIPFNRFEPLSTAFGIVADLAETKDQKNATDAFSKILGTIGNNLTQKTFLQGVTDFASLVKNPTEFAGQYAKNFAGSLVPNIVAKGTQALDPTVRDTRAESTGLAGLPEGALNQIKSRLPGLAQTLPERKGATGETVERPGNAASRFLSPVQVSETKPGTELEQMLVQIGYPPSTPKREVTIPIQGGKPSVKVRLSDEEYATLQAAQERASDYIRKNYIGNPQFERLPDTIEEGGSRSKESLIRRVYDRAHEDARKRLPALPSFRAKVTQARSARA